MVYGALLNLKRHQVKYSPNEKYNIKATGFLGSGVCWVKFGREPDFSACK